MPMSTGNEKSFMLPGFLEMKFFPFDFPRSCFNYGLYGEAISQALIE